MIALVPFDKAREPDLGRGLRLKTEIAARCVDIGESLRNVSGLQRQELLYRRAAEQPLENGDEFEELFWMVIAEIVDAVGDPVRPLRRRAVMRRDRTGDDVVDIGEVARHPALVKDLDRLASQNRPCEQISRHIRAAPRTRTSKEPQSGSGKTVQVAVALHNQFGAAFAGGVERDRLN